MFQELNAGCGSVTCLEKPLPVTVMPPPGISGPAIRKLRILVVDDVDMNRDIARRFLDTVGHDVVCLEDGAPAVAAAAEGDFDVVLMDVRMPGMDGLEATRRIRALGGPRGQVPIVAVTAQVFVEQVEDCRRAGMSSHLAKPFTLDGLLAKVAEAAAHGAAKAEHRAIETAQAPEEALPVLDQLAFDVTASLLPPESLAAFLRTIAERANAFLQATRDPGALTARRSELADMAHALAGSAGMFGFQRLAHAARHFERAVLTATSETGISIIEVSIAAAEVMAEVQFRCDGAVASTH